MALEDHVVFDQSRALAVVGTGYITVAKIRDTADTSVYSWRIFNQADRIIDSSRSVEMSPGSSALQTLKGIVGQILEYDEVWSDVSYGDKAPFSQHLFDWLKKDRNNVRALERLLTEIKGYTE